MVKVAVAGGLGNVGRTIVDTLKDSGRHEVVALSRKAADNAVTVDYTNVESLKEVLENNKVEVVISALMTTDETSAQSQSTLIKAAAKSTSTKRFVASEWGVPISPEVLTALPFSKMKLDAVEELKKTSLEWTRFNNGYFMDYWGMPHIKSHMPPTLPVLDVANKVAAIPGDGNTPVVFTYTYDVAKFVVAALDLPNWDDEYYVVGDRLTWNEFVKLAEDARGSKFEIHYDSIEKLKSFQITELPNHVAAYQFFPKEQLQGLFAAFELLMATGKMDLPEGKALNKKFPEIKTLTVKQLFEQTWKGK
ncbi:NmrA-like protein [Macrophomina phaseolina MS6]|uniref:NmrA-like protein n=1 Tax=Macrophomina phaseolina (strain MS6) TaxID=1126212 RepID=K2S0J8_MACPH|nr:NmrA-like protein [Macrophomina phaseolina MS6]